MPPGTLNSSQKAALSQFTSFTQADKKTSERILKAHHWNVQQAVDAFFNGQTSSRAAAPDPHAAPLNKLFDKYRDPSAESPDTLNIDETMNYLTDLSLSPDNIAVLVLSEIVASPSIGELPRAGFVSGWSAHGATTVATQKKVLADQTSQLGSPAARSVGGIFRRVYKHTFKLALPPGSKSVPLEMAVEYWRLLLGDAGFSWSGDHAPWLDWWTGFLEERWKKAVNKDLWDQTLLFADKTMQDGTLSWWSEESAWPGVIDEFVEWAKTEKGVGGVVKVDEMVE